MVLKFYGKIVFFLLLYFAYFVLISISIVPGPKSGAIYVVKSEFVKNCIKFF